MQLIAEVLEAGPISADIVDVSCGHSLSFKVDARSKVAVVTVEHPIGVRVLDEGDLLEYWNAGLSQKKGWLYEIKSGGWLAQEQARSGFESGRSSRLREFMAISDGWCVSVLSEFAPKVRWYAPEL